ncbi:hypothetical protein [Spirosoma koreense]
MHNSPADIPTDPSMSPTARRFWITQAILLLASSLIVGTILILPKNRYWLTNIVGRFYTQRQTLGNKTDVQFRRQKGYAEAYPLISLIQQRCQPNDYFLIPPQRYLIRNAYPQGKASGFAWVYPSVLYYHLGRSVHLLDMTAPDSLLQRATHTFWAYDNKLFLLTFKPHNRPLVLDEFRKYDPHFFAYTPAQARRYYQSKP